MTWAGQRAGSGFGPAGNDDAGLQRHRCGNSKFLSFSYSLVLTLWKLLEKAWLVEVISEEAVVVERILIVGQGMVFVYLED
jgi:hypothetical protein